MQTDTDRRVPNAEDLAQEFKAKGINIYDCMRCRLCTEELNRGLLTETRPYQKAFKEKEWRSDIFNEAVCPTWDYFHHEAYTAFGRSTIARALTQGLELDPKDEKMRAVIYTCLLCGGCQEVCFSRNRVPLIDKYVKVPRSQWDLLGIYLSMRVWLYKKYGPEILPPGLREIGEVIKRTRNVYGKPKHAATHWMQEAPYPVKDLSKGAKADVLLLLDYRGPFDQRYWPAIISAGKILNSVGISWGVLGEDEVCTGDELMDSGVVEDYNKINEADIARVKKIMKASGVKKVVTMDDEGYHVWLSDRLDYGFKDLVDFDFQHIIQYLSELNGRGKLKLKKRISKEVVLHDTCHVSRYFGEFDGPRELIESIPGIKLREMTMRREYLYCCGGNAGMAYAYPEYADWWGKKRLEMAKSALTSGGNTVISHSPKCELHLMDVNEKHKMGLNIENICTLVAQSIIK
jgi:heterodisulfide reductase subunit D